MAVTLAMYVAPKAAAKPVAVGTGEVVAGFCYNYRCGKR